MKQYLILLTAITLPLTAISAPFYTVSASGNTFIEAEAWSVKQGTWLEKTAQDASGNSYLESEISSALSRKETVFPEAGITNLPNPFRPFTTIHLCLPASLTSRDKVEMAIYDVGGKLIKKFQPMDRPGKDRITVKWHGQDRFGNDTGAGIYIARARAGRYIYVKKLIMIR
jgi:hypothetical protein